MVSYPLCRTIRLLIEAGFLERLSELFADIEHETITPKLAHAILLCVVPVRLVLLITRVARSSVVESSTFCPKQYIFRGLAVNGEKELTPLPLNAFASP